ncbi:MAG: PilT/PilU family type 4a pilus ATPase [Planctomycetes bacterium]|nr:PilT/PilU family type 4a pilus ATPase [Planctomycetota bacterium]
MKLMEILRAARAKQASDVHLVAGLPPAVRINGEILMANAAPIEAAALRRMIEEILNEDQRRHLEAERELCLSVFDGEAGRVRVALYYHAGNLEMAARLCTLLIPDRASLGLPPIVDELARKPNGLVLIAGPTGSGKTTTLNYMVDLINRERRCKIVMIEDPVEYVHRPQKSIVVQQEVYTDTHSFPRALVHVLRQNPDVIVVGEMRELDAIRTALTAAETGHLVLATLHTPNTTQTVERITAVFPEGQQEQIILQLANSLQAVVTQVLLPRADRKGRVLACEIMVANGAVRNIIREKNIQLLYGVVETSRKDGMMTLDHSLLDLYQKAVITYDVAVTHARSPERFTS